MTNPIFASDDQAETGNLPLYPPRMIPSFDEVEDAVRRGGVVRRERGELAIYTYTRASFYRGLFEGWDDPVVAACRGLVYNTNTGECVAVPFPKFFNVEENEDVRIEKLPQEPMLVTEKLDGSLIILFFDGTTWQTATKGSLDSLQSEWAMKWITENMGLETLEGLEDFTMLFEGIYPSDIKEGDLVVDYEDREELVLLAAYHTRLRAEVRPDGVLEIAKQLEVQTPDRFEFDTLQDALEARENLTLDSEGFVIQYLESGLRVKLKGDPYLKLSKRLGEVSLQTMWAAMREGRVPRDYFDGLPVTKIDDLMPWKEGLEKRHERLLQAVEGYVRQAKEKQEGRERGVWVEKNVPGIFKGAVFSMLSGNRKRALENIWKGMEPHAGGWNPAVEKLLSERKGRDRTSGERRGR